MIFNLYKYSEQEKKLNKTDMVLSKDLLNKLNLFEKEIIGEYFEKQFGKKGIVSLGDEIRKNSKISNEVFVRSNDYELVKITGNRKTFLKDFLSTISRNKTSKSLFFLIYERHFRNESSIVDGTSTTINDFENDIGLLNDAFENVNFNQDIYVIEITGIKNHYFKTDKEKFTKIFKRDV
tara:strand:+ start:877 stop:1413 length:537 start_codon:yes stop_codon:yes gene_type:complete